MENRTTEMDIIIIRQLDGTATSGEKRMLLQWLKASDRNRTDYVEIRDLWLSCGAAAGGDEATLRALNRLLNRLRSERPSVTRERRLLRWYRAAAAVALLLLLGAGGWFAANPRTDGKTATLQNRLITARGSSGKVILPDGSAVRLNAESSLTYPESFDGAERLVHLEGEGYFEVAADRTKPFVVQSGDLAVEALGTVFNVSGYSRQRRTEVLLLEGSVRVTSPVFGKDVLLTPNQMLELTGEGEIHIHKANARWHTCWIHDRIVFDNDCLSDIIIALESWYRIDIECPAAFAEKTRMSFTVGTESIQEILKAMSLVIPVTCSVADGTVTIAPKHLRQHK
ncbi:MAG: FecR domain-containing protein [Tannerella sp.]|jgi:ferric-dicitrate binding protein FerR (iron transport regulator)|nr:FecR domain-containing protein [Tannerella sp.]